MTCVLVLYYYFEINVLITKSLSGLWCGVTYFEVLFKKSWEVNLHLAEKVKTNVFIYNNILSLRHISSHLFHFTSPVKQ